MTDICLNLNNFTNFNFFLGIFPESNLYEFTAKKIFRLKAKVVCCCGHCMVHNGYDYARKKGLGGIKIGKQKCSICGAEHREDKGFWKSLLSKWNEVITKLVVNLRDSHTSWEVISKVMSFILPCGKDKLVRLFNNAVDQFEYGQDNFVIVNYDEQHPKQGRTQKFRLTLLNYNTMKPIADELFDNKDDGTIELFLRKNLDANKQIVLITDCDRRYPAIFRKIWGNKVIHQKCLLHLNKLIVKDFGKCGSLLAEYNKYLVLNIFYNREKELKFIEKFMKKQDTKKFSGKQEKNQWVKEAKHKFYEYIKNMENTRRRNKKNLTQRKLFKAKAIFRDLVAQKMYFSKKIRARLSMIQENWKYLTAFYHVAGCPATNNAIENFYSTSLKTHRKKQLRTEKGLLNQMKLSAMKREKTFFQPAETILDVFLQIRAVTT